MANQYPQRVAHVEYDVPHELIEVAALINYNAYSQTELDDKCAQLKQIVREKLSGRLKPRPKQNLSSQRQVPAHIPDKLLDVFNAFEFPELSKFEKYGYKMALEVWVRSNLKLR